MDRLCSTKFPLYLVLMELSEQLRTRNLALSVVWRPRDENEEADALTNERFGSFRPELRIPVRWSALQFLVLPRLADAATEHFEALRAVKDAGRQRSPQLARKAIYVGVARGQHHPMQGQVCGWIAFPLFIFQIYLSDGLQKGRLAMN